MRPLSIRYVALLGLVFGACGGRIANLNEASEPADGASPQTPPTAQEQDAGSTAGGPSNPPAERDAASPVEIVTCEMAARIKSNVGCEFWPADTRSDSSESAPLSLMLVNANPIDAIVNVDGPTSLVETIPAQSAKRIDLSGGGRYRRTSRDVEESLIVGGTFHLTSSLSIAVHQFIENKDDILPLLVDGTVLLPSHALTQSYVVGSKLYGDGSSLTISAIEDGTTLSIRIGSQVRAIESNPTIVIAGATSSRHLNRGDALTLIGTGDFAGTDISADHPLQVVSSDNRRYGIGRGWAHVEEALLPLEAWGRHHVIASATGYAGFGSRQGISIQGRFNHTKLTYLPARPAGCPETIEAGESLACGPPPGDNMFAVTTCSESFEIVASREIGVSLLHLGASDPVADLANSSSIPVEQFRTRYTFAIPPCEIAYADLVASPNTRLMVDGNVVSDPPEAISSNFVVYRTRLSGDPLRVHVLEGDKPFGAQIIGYGQVSLPGSGQKTVYGSFASFQMPAGLGLEAIASPLLPHP